MPLRIGLALGTTPWVDENIVQPFLGGDDDGDGGGGGTGEAASEAADAGGWTASVVPISDEASVLWLG